MSQVKICGITNEEDALCAAKLGAAALGFIFYPPSPRYVRPKVVRKIVKKLLPNLAKVGVFVNESAEEIKKIIKYCGLDFIQLHGDESLEFCRNFPASTIIKTVELLGESDLVKAFSYNAAAILVDSRHAGLYGGTGKKADWDLAFRVKSKKPLILSGGLNEENVKEVIEKIVPHALDINSGVEKSPGKKDHIKLARIFDIVRAANFSTDNAPLIFTKREI
jgi:phosphoribosylanthranilate isomerase